SSSGAGPVTRNEERRALGTSMVPDRSGVRAARSGPGRVSRPLPSHSVMSKTDHFEIFLATAPGLESVLWEEVKSLRFRAAKQVPGGVTVNGNWRDAWRANLEVRGANKVLARIDAFRTFHLDDLQRRARRVAW